MKPLLLGVLIAALPLAAQAAGPIAAKSKTSCDWINGILVCQSKTETEHSVTRTLCGYGLNAQCSTTTRRKPPPEPPRPLLPPSRVIDPSGVAVMRGMPLR